MFDEMDESDKSIELIEPEIIEIQKHTRKKKPSLEEQFKDIPTRQVLADTLTDEDKICPECGSEMLAIGTEKIRSEIVYTPPKLERIEYLAVTYACPKCKETEEPQFIKDNGKPALIPHSYVSESLRRRKKPKSTNNKNTRPRCNKRGLFLNSRSSSYFHYKLYASIMSRIPTFRPSSKAVFSHAQHTVPCRSMIFPQS